MKKFLSLSIVIGVLFCVGLTFSAASCQSDQDFEDRVQQEQDDAIMHHKFQKEVEEMSGI